jgi:hypothetical protein
MNALASPTTPSAALVSPLAVQHALSTAVAPAASRGPVCTSPIDSSPSAAPGLPLLWPPRRPPESVAPAVGAPRSGARASAWRSREPWQARCTQPAPASFRSTRPRVASAPVNASTRPAAPPHLSPAVEPQRLLAAARRARWPAIQRASPRAYGSAGRPSLPPADVRGSPTRTSPAVDVGLAAAPGGAAAAARRAAAREGATRTARRWTRRQPLSSQRAGQGTAKRWRWGTMSSSERPMGSAAWSRSDRGSSSTCSHLGESAYGLMRHTTQAVNEFRSVCLRARIDSKKC